MTRESCYGPQRLSNPALHKQRPCATLRTPTPMKSAFAYAFALAAIGLLVHTQVNGEGLAVTVEPLESETVVGEPVVLRCEFGNETETPALLDLGFNDTVKISFVLDPAGQSPVALTEVQRGGGGDFGTRIVEIAPHHRINRYVVLNQWFRPSKAGVYPLEIVMKTGDKTITGRFQITVSVGDATAVGTRAEGLIQKYLKYLGGAPIPMTPGISKA
jgi:hypothetical protein